MCSNYRFPRPRAHWNSGFMTNVHAKYTNNRLFFINRFINYEILNRFDATNFVIDFHWLRRLIVSALVKNPTSVNSVERHEDSDYLKNQMIIHTGENPYKCEQWGKTFALIDYLKKHTIIHTGENPFKCEQCGKTCEQSDHLKNHMIIHTGENPYKCEQYGKTFAQGGNLKKHMMTHTGEKAYKCEQCGRKFRQSGH